MKGPEGFIMYSNEPPYKNTIPSPSYKTAGIANCPWNIEVKKGQMINLTLLTIANKDKTGGSMHCSDELQVMLYLCIFLLQLYIYYTIFCKFNFTLIFY